jgi:hypothetical protein
MKCDICKTPLDEYSTKNLKPFSLQNGENFFICYACQHGLLDGSLQPIFNTIIKLIGGH